MSRRAAVALALCWPAIVTASQASSAQPVPSLHDINETGQVLAQLNDVRAIFFVLIVVIALLMMIVLWVVKALLGNLSEGVKELATSIDNMTKASADRTTADLVNHARLESIMSRSEHYLAIFAARDKAG